MGIFTAHSSGRIDVIMKKIVGTLIILFSILTFIGAGYVLSQDGNANAGYACVPMVLALVCMSIYRQKK